MKRTSLAIIPLTAIRSEAHAAPLSDERISSIVAQHCPPESYRHRRGLLIIPEGPERRRSNCWAKPCTLSSARSWRKNVVIYRGGAKDAKIDHRGLNALRLCGFALR